MLSIIIPTYNSQKTIKRCLKSILQLSRIKFEIIIVDDGSYDNTTKILSIYNKKYKNIHAFFNKHHNTSYERNYGLNKSHGSWICFVDSDDYISSQKLEKAINNLDNTDLIITNLSINRNKVTKIKHPGEFNVKQFIDINYPLYGDNIIHSIGNKLYNKNMINKYHIKFPNFQGMGEDLIFNLKCISHAFRNIKALNISYYNIVINKHSTTHTFEKDALNHKFIILKCLFKIFIRHKINNPLKNELKIRVIYSALLNIFKKNNNSRNKTDYIRNIRKNPIYMILLPNTYLNCDLKYKILLFMLKHIKSTYLLYLYLYALNIINKLNK